MGIETIYERPVTVGNKVFVGLTIKKIALRSEPYIDVGPFMSKIEHIMYISPVTNLRPVNLALATDQTGDDMKYPIVMDGLVINFPLNGNNLNGSEETFFNLGQLDSGGRSDINWHDVSTGGEIAKFLIIGSK